MEALNKKIISYCELEKNIVKELERISLGYEELITQNRLYLLITYDLQIDFDGSEKEKLLMLKYGFNFRVDWIGSRKIYFNERGEEFEF